MNFPLFLSIFVFCRQLRMAEEVEVSQLVALPKDKAYEVFVDRVWFGGGGLGKPTIEVSWRWESIGLINLSHLCTRTRLLRTGNRRQKATPRHTWAASAGRVEVCLKVLRKRRNSPAVGDFLVQSNCNTG